MFNYLTLNVLCNITLFKIQSYTNHISKTDV